MQGEPLTNWRPAPSAESARLISNCPSAQGSAPCSTSRASISRGLSTAKTASTVQDSAPLRMSDLSARTPRSSCKAPMRMDLPAPVSPVMATMPGPGSHARSSTSARFLMRRDASVATTQHLMPRWPFPSWPNLRSRFSAPAHPRASRSWPATAGSAARRTNGTAACGRPSSSKRATPCSSSTPRPISAPRPCATDCAASMPRFSPIRTPTTSPGSTTCGAFANWPTGPCRSTPRRTPWPT